MLKVTTISLNRFRGRTQKLAPLIAGGWGLGYLFVQIHGQLRGGVGWNLRWDMFDLYTWFFSLFMAAGNWFLRIAQWKTAVSIHRVLRWRDAACQQLKSFAWAAFTPALIGEWPGKIWFYENREGIFRSVTRQQIVQMGVTLSMGMVAMMRVGILWWVLIGFVVVVLVRLLKIKQLTYWFRLAGLSVLRYLFFASMLVMILYVWHPEVGLEPILRKVAIYYFWSSVVPLAFGWELPIKGGIGVWQFGMLGYTPLEAGAAVGWMWIWNTLVPVLVGQLLLWTRKNCGYV